MSFSIAPLLKRQSQSPSFGHGWIATKSSERWHPCNDQQQLLRELSTRRQSVLQRIKCFIGG